ncbi:MAG: hypothetical protein K8R60_19345 [Burkholderiales bacterium]|nr:hypothetical protein [Burkholderiales bacterium]
MRANCGAFSADLPVGWADTTDANAPFTLCKQPDGVGALQFSIARYRSGVQPKINTSVLLGWLQELAESSSRGPAESVMQEDGDLRLAAGSFFPDSQTFARAWYASDGANVAKVTYVCAKQDVGSELVEAERIVRSIRFEHHGT